MKSAIAIQMGLSTGMDARQYHREAGKAPMPPDVAAETAKIDRVDTPVFICLV